MSWQGINEFVAVAEHESFTKAAQTLVISTAQVSRQVSALEKRLNTKLLYRTTRRISLTEEGRVFYQHCRGVLDALATAERSVTHLQSTPQGHIKLTAPVTYGEQHILPLVNDFIKQYPTVTVSAHLTNRKVDLVDEGYDLAIRLGQLTDSSMMAKRLAQRTNFLCASPSYLEKYGAPHTIAELDTHNCLLGTLDYWRFQEKGQEKSIRVAGSLRYNSGLALVDATLKGLGLAQLPDYYVQQHIEQDTLVTLLDQYRMPDEGIWAVYPYNRQLSPKISMLVEYLVKQMSG